MQISSEQIDRVAQFGRQMSRDTETPDIERIAGLYPRGFISIVASMAGTGKTWLMQLIACQLSMGGRILDGLVARSRKYKSVILSGETGTFLLDKRLGKTNWEYEPERIRVYSAVDMMMNDIPCMLNTAEGQQTIISICALERPDIVFFDTLISFHSVDESKQGEMTAIYTFLLRLAKAFDCAVVVNHHTRKRPANLTGKRFTQEDIIGTSAGVRLCSAAFVIMAQDNLEGGSKMTVTNVKNWDKKVPEFSYEFVTTDEGYVDFSISFDTSDKNFNWSLRERLAQLISSYDMGAMLRLQAMAKELSVNPETLRYHVDQAIKKGLLEKRQVLNETVYVVK